MQYILLPMQYGGGVKEMKTAIYGSTTNNF